MSSWKRIWIVCVCNLLWLILLAGVNHALSGLSLFLLLHGLLVLFAGLRMNFSPGLIVTAISASLTSAFVYQVELLPWYLISFVVLYLFFYRMRLKVRRNCFLPLALVAGAGSAILFLVLSVVNQFYYGIGFSLARLFYDLLFSVGASALLSKWIMDFHFSIFMLLGTNLNKEVVSS